MPPKINQMQKVEQQEAPES